MGQRMCMTRCLTLGKQVSQHRLHAPEVTRFRRSALGADGQHSGWLSDCDRLPGQRRGNPRPTRSRPWARDEPDTLDHRHRVSPETAARLPGRAVAHAPGSSGSSRRRLPPPWPAGRSSTITGIRPGVVGAQNERRWRLRARRGAPELVAATRDRLRAMSVPDALVRQSEDAGVANSLHVERSSRWCCLELGVHEGAAASPA